MMTPEEKQAASERRKRIKKFKHYMEITRTVCAVGAFCLNAIVLSHVMGLW